MSFNRRKFVSMLAASGSLAGLGYYGYTRSKQPDLPPSDRVTIAIIGLRGYGKKLLKKFAKLPQCYIAYLCDVDTGVGQKTVAKAEKLTGHKPKFVVDMRHIFDDPTVDAVVIATPHHWHALAAIWAMQAGKDVYLEKPVSHNIQEGLSLIAAARKYNRICQSGTQLRSKRVLMTAMDFMHGGGIGEVKLARCTAYKRRKPIGLAGQYPVPKEVDYNLWSGPAQVLPIQRKRFHYDWHWDWEYGNGGLGNNGVHRVDVARWGLQVTGLGDSVTSYGGRFGEKDMGETPNTQVTFHEFGEKTIIQELRGLPTKPPEDFEKGDGVAFYGTDGKIVYGKGKARLFDDKGKLVKSFKPKKGEEGSHHANFLASRKKPKISGFALRHPEGHFSSGLCHVGSISHRVGMRATDEEIKKTLAQLQTNDDATATFELETI